LSLVGLSEQATFTIPAFGVFPSLSWDASAADETSCKPTLSKFETGFQSPPANCSSFTPSTADWNNFKAGVVQPATPTYSLGTSFDTCTQATLPTGGVAATQTALCNYVNAVSKASTFCNQLYCITDNANVNVGVSTTCSGTGQRTCKSLLPSAITVLKEPVKATTLPATYSYDWTKVDATCADNCRASGATYTIPSFGVFPTLTWDATVSDATSCTATISKFVTGFPSPPANCTSFTPSTADWNNFKKGVVPVTGDTYNLGTSFDTCKAATPLPTKPPAGTSAQDMQTALCNYVNEVSKASTFCDKLYCITDNANVGVSTTCSGTGQRTCKSLLPSANSVLKAAVDATTAPKLPSGVAYNWSLVDVTCADNCRSVASGNGGDTGGNTGGAMGVSLVAFAVVSGLSVSLM